MKTFTREDVGRVLGLADQFLEDWEATLDDINEPDERDRMNDVRGLYEQIKPLLLAAPELLQFAINVSIAIEENGGAANVSNMLEDANEIIGKIQAP